MVKPSEALFSRLVKQPEKIIIFTITFFITLYLAAFYSVELGEYGDDDIAAQQKLENSSVWEILVDNYETWNTRFAADGFFSTLLDWDLFWIWPLISVTILAVIPLFLLRNTMGWYWNVERWQLIVLCYAIFGVISLEVMIPSVYWFVGSFNYLYPGLTLLIALVPLSDMILQPGKTKQFEYVLAILASLLLFFQNEQFGAALAAFVGLVFLWQLYRFWKKKTSRLSLLYPGIMTVILAMIAWWIYEAPGNENRYWVEVAARYPEFNDLNVFSKLQRGIRLLVVRLVNHYWWTWAIPLAVLLFEQSYLQIRSQKALVFLVTTFGAALVSQLLISFSPTIYASGPRVHFIYFVLLLLATVFILGRIKQESLEKIFLPMLLFLATASVYHVVRLIDVV